MKNFLNRALEDSLELRFTWRTVTLHLLVFAVVATIAIALHKPHYGPTDYYNDGPNIVAGHAQ